MTKKLNTDHIRNELADSLFFRTPRSLGEPPAPVTATPAEPTSPVGQSLTAPPERVNARTGERAVNREIITRNSFEIYEYQMQSLRQRAYQEKLAGKLGSMSRMVRDAINRYLQDTSTEDTD